MPALALPRLALNAADLSFPGFSIEGNPCKGLISRRLSDTCSPGPGSGVNCLKPLASFKQLSL